MDTCTSAMVVCDCLATSPTGSPPTSASADRRPSGDEWFMVLSGTVQLLLHDRSHVVEAGDAASLSTMVPHAMGALDGPAEVLLVLDRDGDQVHRYL